MPYTPRGGPFAVRLGELLLAATLAALLTALVDGISIFVADSGTATAEDVWVPMHLFAWVLPVALAATLPLYGAVQIARGASWLSAVRGWLGSPRRWVRSEPSAFSGFVGALFGLAAYATSLFFALKLVRSVIVSTFYRDVATVLIAILLAVVGLLVAAAAGYVAGAVAKAAPWLARPILPMAAVLLAVGALGVARADQLSMVLAGAFGRRVLAVAVVVLASALSLFVARLVVPGRLGVRGQWIAGASTVVASLVLFAISALSYDGARLRELTEGKSLYGATLARLYRKAFDRDGDGYANYFGGGDCDDSRANVYPGAEERDGDNVDSDCFAGDSTPLVAPLGDGRFAPTRQGGPRPNFLLITVDALRADALSIQGGRRRTPHMDALARSGTRFSYAVSSSSRTITAMPSIMTGLYPSQIERGPEFFYPSLPEKNLTLAERLRAAGYTTVAIAGTRFFSRVGGYFQGFDTVLQAGEERSPRPWPVDQTIEQLDRLRAGDKPWFLWVHLFNTHAEYLADGTPSRYGDKARDKYDTEVHLVDEEIGRLEAALGSRGLKDSTTVIFTSDHGEAFGEHGTFFHEYVYEEELRVPLIVRVPGMGARVSDVPISGVDILPTILNLADTSMGRPIAGWSLLPLLSGVSDVHAWRSRYLFSERLPDSWATIHALVIRRDHLRLTWFPKESRIELFDLAKDPRQRVNIVDEREAEAREMTAYLRAWLWRTGAHSNVSERVISENRLPAPPRQMTKTLNLRYPFFTLLGYDLDKTDYRRGEAIKFTFYYLVHKRTEINARFNVEFELPAGFQDWFFMGNHEPLQGHYPTTEWVPGEILRDEVVVPVPPFLPVPMEIKVNLVVGITGRVQQFEDANGLHDELELPTIRIGG